MCPLPFFPSRRVYHTRLWVGSHVLPRHSAVIKTFLSSENDVQPPPEFVCRQSHHLVIRVFEQGLPIHGDLNVAGLEVVLAQIPELAELPAERALVCPGNPVNALGSAQKPRASLATRHEAALSSPVEGL